MTLFEKDKQYIANTYARFPVEIVRGKGAEAFDGSGKRYIDMGAGIAVNSFGYSDDVWAEAVTEQINTLQHTSNLYYTEPCVRLAEMLCAKTGLKKVFFGNSGAEANEAAIKAARLYAEKKTGGPKPIITLCGSFHGRTLGTLAATGQDAFHKDFLPLCPGFLYTEPNDFEAFSKLADETPCAAVMMEMIQGEGGVNKLDEGFVKAVADYAHSHDMLVIVDEVQTGNGRSGALYAYMKFGIEPDIVTTAKGLGGGLPIGACMLGERVSDIYTPGTHGSTFGANPVCCAGAVSILERIDGELLAGVEKKSEYIINRLEACKGVRSVSGMGLMLGVECEKDKAEVIAACREKGLLVLSAKNKIRLLPPLNISDELLAEAMDILISVIEA
ncbi:MAG: acetylornithine/succinylornithine family transaminase [Clostridia bacterium]|nr:acetylornithine/succinylornithine family transaminase [Clostridia bacterium]